MSNFSNRSLSPDSFERFRSSNDDYFYKPKRGPSTSKSNITITRPIRPVQCDSSLFELIGNTKKSKINDDLNSNSSSLFSNESIDSSLTKSTNSSLFSSRSNSSISNGAEQENQIIFIDDPTVSTPLIAGFYRFQFFFLDFHFFGFALRKMVSFSLSDVESIFIHVFNENSLSCRQQGFVQFLMKLF